MSQKVQSNPLKKSGPPLESIKSWKAVIESAFSEFWHLLQNFTVSRILPKEEKGRRILVREHFDFFTHLPTTVHFPGSSSQRAGWGSLHSWYSVLVSESQHRLCSFTAVVLHSDLSADFLMDWHRG